MRILFGSYAARQGKRRFGEKTPVNVRNIPFLADLFPEAVFLHIIRDGRDVTLSYLDVPWGPTSVAESAIYWKLAVEEGRRDGSALGPRRYRELKYEELVEDPEATLRELCRSLRLPFDPAMLRYHERADDVRKGFRNPGAHRNLSRPPTKGLRSWREQMQADDLGVFEMLAGATLEEFGYERALRSVPLPVRLRAQLTRAEVQVRRATGRAEKVGGMRRRRRAGKATDEPKGKEEPRMRMVGVIGLGTVGGALLEALGSAGVPVASYDPYLGVGAPESLSDCSIVFLCVPTPESSSGTLDTSAVWKAVRDVEANLADGTLVAVKSTVPPGTSAALSGDFPRFDFASVPEFLVAARPMETLRHPDRVLIGVRKTDAFLLIADVMRRVAPGSPILMLSPTEAELAKLAANAMLAAKVSMANELALVCERFDVDWSDIQSAVGLDRRVGVDHLSVTAERGFSGGCLPKDLDGLIGAAREAGYEAPLLSRIATFNREVRSMAGATDLVDVTVLQQEHVGGHGD